MFHRIRDKTGIGFEESSACWKVPKVWGYAACLYLQSPSTSSVCSSGPVAFDVRFQIDAIIDPKHPVVNNSVFLRNNLPERKLFTQN